MQFQEFRQSWLAKAEAFKPSLESNVVLPKHVVGLRADTSAFQGWRAEPSGAIGAVYERTWERNESFILDFGEYLVGYLDFELQVEGTVDAPARLKLTFGEMPAEVEEPFEPYNGSLSRAWLQDEIINLDTLPQTVRLPRRYAFRFLKVELIDISSAYRVKFTNIACRMVSSADYGQVPELATSSAVARELDRVSLRTLSSCMQTVFEDGPKRDRRLWLGDLRLQALADAASFRNFDLVKRCLYLFAAFAHENGLVPACVFEVPEPHRGHCDILDYAALFVPTLLEYAEASGDWETAHDLWPVAFRQLEGVLEYVNENGLFIDPGNWWIFIDWQQELHKQTAMNGVLLYCLGQGIELARRLGLEDQVAELQSRLEQMTAAAKVHLFDSEQGLFLSGEVGQVSWASQVWMILASVVSPEEGAEVLLAVKAHSGAVLPAGPYLYHYVVEAMLLCGLVDEARDLLQSYWGGMIERGANTFWEVYDPGDAFLSPYGSHLINSYCHAWSCTPAYFVRRYPGLFG